MGNLVADLRAITGPAHVLTEPDVVAGYATDWTRRYTGAATCVVSPGTTTEVAEVVRACAGYGARIIPQGGNTGLVGGSIPPARSVGQDCVILSTRRLTGLEPVDPLAAPGHRGSRGHGGPASRPRRSRRMALRRRPGVAGLRHGRRHHRHERGRHPHDQVRAHEVSGRRARRGTRRRQRRRQPGRAHRWHHRLRPDAAADRQRGHARGDHARRGWCCGRPSRPQPCCSPEQPGSLRPRSCSGR